MAEQAFDYIAVDPAGRRTRGRLQAQSESAAFERLKSVGLSPVRLQFARGEGPAGKPKSGILSDRDAIDLLSDLSALLAAGADIRASLSILAARSNRAAMANLARTLSSEISGGAPIEQAFARHFVKGQGFVSALVAAGSSVGDIAGGCRRAADLLSRRNKVRDQLISAASYPAFVFVSTIAAIVVILLFVVPSLAPLAQQDSGPPPMMLSMLLGASSALRENGLVGAIIVAIATIALLAAARLGMLARPWDRAVLDGPANRTASRLVYGAFANSLGGMLAAGAPMSDALRLSVRTITSGLARERIEVAVQGVRQGQPLSIALEGVRHFPSGIVRLTAVGEATGALGPMLVRAANLEEEAAVKRLEAFGRLLSPLLIVLMGAMVGLLMAALLTGVTQVGQTALQ